MRRGRRWTAAVRAWPVWELPVWELPGWLRAYVLVTIAAGAAALAAAAALATWHAGSLRLFAVLLGCDLATVELTRRQQEPGGGLIKECFAVWELPIALLLSPVFALLAPIARMAVTQWRVRQALLYRRVFSVAALGMSYAAGSVAFHALAPTLAASLSAPSPRVQEWVLVALACGVVRSGVNKLLVETAVKAADRTASIRADLFTGEALFGDLAELCAGVLIAYAATGSPPLVLLGLPFTVLLQRSLRHRQLVSEARIDGLTGVLNQATWYREAAVQVTRARQTGGYLAVVVMDIDRFKTNVNDEHGHPAGNIVLAGLPRILADVLRPYDLIGRTGIGDEFSVLLPRTGAEEARMIADRLREAVAETAFQVPSKISPAASENLQITVSIGVAALADGHHDLDDLFMDADVAMYRAKTECICEHQPCHCVKGNRVCAVDD